MSALVALVVFGFFLGMRHAADPDHVIAVTTIVSRQRKVGHAAVVGMLWGIGHLITILAVGIAIIVFGVVIPAHIGLKMEMSVGVMLVVLGGLSLWGFMRSAPAAAGSARVHAHPHTHGDYIHSHPHGHEPDTHGHAEDDTPQGWLDRTFGRLGLYQALRPVIIGVVHGLAGSAPVALLVLAAIRDPFWAIAYLMLFGVGTIAGMMLITAAIAVPFAFTRHRLVRFNRLIGIASGLVSLIFGLYLVYRLGVDGGLL